MELVGLPDPQPASKDAVIAAASPKEKIFFNFMQYFLLFLNKKARWIICPSSVTPLLLINTLYYRKFILSTLNRKKIFPFFILCIFYPVCKYPKDSFVILYTVLQYCICFRNNYVYFAFAYISSADCTFAYISSAYCTSVRPFFSKSAPARYAAPINPARLPSSAWRSSTLRKLLMILAEAFCFTSFRI